MDRNLRAFLSVARRGNLTAASEEIGLTQPAVTKTIRRLEAEVGAELFERNARGMLLNDAGRRFLRRAEAIENQYQFVAEEMAALHRREKAVLRVVAGVAYQAGLATRMAARLVPEFPETLIDLRAGLVEASKPELMRGEIDLIAGALSGPPPDGIVTRPLMPVDVVVFAGPNNPLHNAAEVSLRELGAFPWITFQRDGYTERRLERAFDDLCLPPPRTAIVANSIHACLEIVAASDALTAAAHPILPVAEALGLRQLPLRQPLWSFVSGLWLRESALDFPVIRRAAEILEELSAEVP